MAKRRISNKRLSNLPNKFIFSASEHLDILLTAALALPGLGIASEVKAQQSATDSTFFSVGYLDYQDQQKGGRGVSVQSPTLYFKAPIGPRTEIQGGLLYDSISGASSFSLSALQSKPTPATPTPVTPTPPSVIPQNCKVLPIQALTRASGGTTTPVVVAPKPPAPKPPSTTPKPPANTGGSTGGSSTGGNSSGGTNTTPICPAGTVPIVSTATGGGSSNGSNNNGNSTSGYGNNNHENEHEEEDRRLYQNTLKSQSLSGNTNEYGYFKDQRYAGDVKITHYLDSFSIGTGVGYSTENDYDSLTLVAETKIWTPDKNTTFALGVSGNFDTVASSADPILSESKHSQTFIVGVTQVLTANAIMQSNVTFNNQQGYLTDPYLPADDRPNSRQGFAWLNRYNLYIEPLDAALHLDYRLYNDAWGVLSHMFEAALYQPITEGFMLRPSIRYYTQSNADFYTYDGTPVTSQSYYTVDQRLSSFGSVTLGLKAIAQLGAGFTGSVGYNVLTQDSALQLGTNKASTSRDSLTAQFIFVELSKKF